MDKSGSETPTIVDTVDNPYAAGGGEVRDNGGGIILLNSAVSFEGTRSLGGQRAFLPSFLYLSLCVLLKIEFSIVAAYISSFEVY